MKPASRRPLTWRLVRVTAIHFCRKSKHKSPPPYERLLLRRCRVILLSQTTLKGARRPSESSIARMPQTSPPHAARMRTYGRRVGAGHRVVALALNLRPRQVRAFNRDDVTTAAVTFSGRNRHARCCRGDGALRGAELKAHAGRMLQRGQAGRRARAGGGQRRPCHCTAAKG